ncbi:hypothetical protein RIF29_40018 [Crotalaria pallida]|uniref:Uncharacterized protein n=1 Tax=Crotalaria pallida TaxID=3830 RepID=A0AAN9E5C7_CROPI
MERVALWDIGGKEWLHIWNSMGTVAVCDCRRVVVVVGEWRWWFSWGMDSSIANVTTMAYYLAMPFPIEKAPTKKLANLNGVVMNSWNGCVRFCGKEIVHIVRSFKFNFGKGISHIAPGNTADVLSMANDDALNGSMPDLHCFSNIV